MNRERVVELLRKVRAGSAPDRTARAPTSSPPSSATPLTRPSWTTILATSIPQRISTPRCLAVAASAATRAPTPPLTTVRGPKTPVGLPTC